MRFENACPKSGVYPPPKNRGPKTTFSMISQLKRETNLTAYIFQMKQDIHNRASALETTSGLLRRLKMA